TNRALHSSQVAIMTDKYLPKTFIFIDSSNIYISARNLYNIKVRPENLISLLTEMFCENNIVHTYYFTPENPENEGQSRFFESLERRGIIVIKEPIVERERQLICPNCKTVVEPKCDNCGAVISLPPHKSKKIDILLGSTMLDICDTYDEGILVSGDQDFLPIVKMLRKREGKKIHVVSFKSTLSHVYKYNSDITIFLDDYIDKIEQKPNINKK
ncbi:MAG: NYN domain-containing protein, partial [Candidatus Thermoplasmatota archaeon]|nr:NYN domain-containing protein [Candidatus Thermoplasmatota archaeon]